MDLAITDTTLITMNGEGLGIKEQFSIGITDGKIVELCSTKDFDTSSYNEIIDGSERLVLPGLINAHFHSTSTLLRGCAQDVPEIEWMTKAIGPLGKHLDETHRLTGSKIAVLEGIRTGTTTFAEYSTNTAQLVDKVYLPLGARVVAAETINEISADRSGMGPDDLYPLDPAKGREGLERHSKLVTIAGKSDLVGVMYGPQAVDMVSKETLSDIYHRAAEEERSIHMHVAQGERERRQVNQRYGLSTIGFLRKHDLLNSQLLAAHIHGSSRQEQEIMVKHGVKMVSCQTSIGMIDGIVPPLFEYDRLGGRVGLGTDQVPGVGHANLFVEMRTGALLGKTSQHDPTVLPPWKMLELATIGGARVLGIDDKVGSLEVGKDADIITINRYAPNLLPTLIHPFATIIPNLIYSSSGYEVQEVLVKGRLLVSNGEFTKDLSSVYVRANEQAQELLSVAEEDWRRAGSMMVQYTDQGYL